MAKSTKIPSTTVPRTTRPRRQNSAPVERSTANDVPPSSSLTHGDIALRAYELYLAEGATPGRELDHWLRAETELRDRTVASVRNT
jgi:hypothetical protein